MSERSQSGLGYFPLSVEFEEKFYASGQILGSRFARREGRPSEGAVLSARIVDRTIRPLFDHRLRNDIQVVVTVLAMGEDDPECSRGYRRLTCSRYLSNSLGWTCRCSSDREA